MTPHPDRRRGERKAKAENAALRERLKLATELLAESDAYPRGTMIDSHFMDYLSWRTRVGDFMKGKR